MVELRPVTVRVHQARVCARNAADAAHVICGMSGHLLALARHRESDSLTAALLELQFLDGALDVAGRPHRVLVVVGLDDQVHLQDAAGGRRHRRVGR